MTNRLGQRKLTSATIKESATSARALILADTTIPILSPSTAQAVARRTWTIPPVPGPICGCDRGGRLWYQAYLLLIINFHQRIPREKVFLLPVCNHIRLGGQDYPPILTYHTPGRLDNN